MSCNSFFPVIWLVKIWPKTVRRAGSYSSHETHKWTREKLIKERVRSNLFHRRLNARDDNLCAHISCSPLHLSGKGNEMESRIWLGRMSASVIFWGSKKMNSSTYTRKSIKFPVQWRTTHGFLIKQSAVRGGSAKNASKVLKSGNHAYHMKIHRKCSPWTLSDGCRC